MSFLVPVISALRRRILGISPEEIRYTFEDVRKEIRASRTELKTELATLRLEIDACRARQAEPRGSQRGGSLTG